MVCFFISRTEKMFEVFVYVFILTQQTIKTIKV